MAVPVKVTDTDLTCPSVFTTMFLSLTGLVVTIWDWKYQYERHSL